MAISRRRDGFTPLRPLAVVALLPVLFGSECRDDDGQVPVTCPDSVVVGDTFTTEAGDRPGLSLVTHNGWSVEDGDAVVCVDGYCDGDSGEWEAIAPGVVTLSYSVGGTSAGCGDVYVTLQGSCTVTVLPASDN